MHTGATPGPWSQPSAWKPGRRQFRPLAGEAFHSQNHVRRAASLVSTC